MIRKATVFVILSAVWFQLALIAPSLGDEQAIPNGGDVLQIVPETLELGTLSPGGYVKGIFFMRSPSEKTMKWSTAGPAEWGSGDGRKLEGNLKDSLGYIEVGLKFADEGEQPGPDGMERVLMTLESEGATITLEKALPFASHNEKMDIVFPGGVKSVSLRFETSLHEKGPEISVKPFGIDFGTVEGGRILTSKLQIRNPGKGTLIWKTGVQGNRTAVDGETISIGRYVSFRNEGLKDQEPYHVPGRLEQVLQVTGAWLSSKDGYPVGAGGDETMKVAFSGTGLSVILQPGEACGKMKISVDDSPPGEIECPADSKTRAVIPVAENLREGPHVLMMTGTGKGTAIEGIRLFGDFTAGVPGWVKVFPFDGTTRSETDYVTVTVDSEHLKAGNYAENIIIQSNGGLAVVEVSLTVTREKSVKIIDVYRYVKGNDYLYTGQPEAEDYQFIRQYRKQRLVFRLFREDTPGTKKFLRWYNAARGDHYYSTDADGGKNLRGYVLEGSIGNIGTSRILGTRELYRWVNPRTGCHFYTTELKGEGMAKKGYQFDGIAGYVR